MPPSNTRRAANELGVGCEIAKKYLTRAVEHCRTSGYFVKGRDRPWELHPTSATPGDVRK